jgi:hypothetical protein
MNPGSGWVLRGQSLQSAEPLSWVCPVGPQDVDYVFSAEIVPPPTAEIAKKFPALSSHETARVLRYCQTEILARYESLSDLEKFYFSKPRTWRLTVFNHEGTACQWTYQLTATGIKLAEQEAGSLSWLTEVSAFKLFSALELGESLSSMYLRVNDHFFDAATELELATADVLEDPLILCLFAGNGLSYQRAQLKKLISESR